MKDIKDNLELIRQIAAAAYAAGVEQIELIIAIVIIGSGGNPYVVAIDATQRANLLYLRPSGCSPEAETMFQKVCWGLMQIRGSVARSLGFAGWLPELIEPELNLALGVKYLAQLMDRYRERYGIEGVIAAYQTEAPRKIGDRYVNQGYVDAVMRLMEEHKELAAEIREMIAAEGTSDNTQNTTGSEQDKQDESENVQQGSEGHRAETLDAMTKAQLVELAKSEFGLELVTQSNKKNLIAAILTAQNGQEEAENNQEDTVVE